MQEEVFQGIPPSQQRGVLLTRLELRPEHERGADPEIDPISRMDKFSKS